MQKIISGIQQIGLGIPNVHEAFAWYRKNFGIDTPIFDDKGVAELMLPYTGGEPRGRHAILAINMRGGSGFEIWQYVSRKPQAAGFDVQLGDLGIFVAKIKSKNVAASYAALKAKDVELLGQVQKSPSGDEHFFLHDPYGNIVEVEGSNDWFNSAQMPATGGASGFTVGVSDIAKAKKFYEILGYDEVVYDQTGNFVDFSELPGGKGDFRRVLLRHSQPRKGAFSRFFGASRVELVQSLDRSPRKIFENRLWGDLGYIHICFDVNGMDTLKTECEKKGFPFTVDTGESFDMGSAKGRFAYTEDPDGALIEFVETHKVPVIKKLGWYLNLEKRNPAKPLPRWMVKALGMNKVKD